MNVKGSSALCLIFVEGHRPGRQGWHDQKQDAPVRDEEVMFLENEPGSTAE
jgi:hypothetical protein